VGKSVVSLHQLRSVISRETQVPLRGGLLFMVGGLLVAALCYLTLTPMSRAEKPRTAVPLLPCRVRPTCESRESHLERFASIQSLRCDPRPTMGQPSESGDGSDPRARNRP